jgi:hypothetical protein
MNLDVRLKWEAHIKKKKKTVQQVELIRAVSVPALRRTQVKTLLATVHVLLRLLVTMEILFIGLLLGYRFA